MVGRLVSVCGGGGVVFALFLLFGLMLFASAFSFGPGATGNGGGADDGAPPDTEVEPVQPGRNFFAGFSAGTAPGGTHGYSEDASNPVTGSDALFLGGAGAIYTGDTASYPFEPGLPTEAEPAQAAGGPGRDIFTINIDTLADRQFFQTTDFK